MHKYYQKTPDHWRNLWSYPVPILQQLHSFSRITHLAAGVNRITILPFDSCFTSFASSSKLDVQHDFFPGCVLTLTSLFLRVYASANQSQQGCAD